MVVCLLRCLAELGDSKRSMQRELGEVAFLMPEDRAGQFWVAWLVEDLRL